jgi:hypothetical protein
MDVATALTLAPDTRADVTGFLLLVSGQPPIICAELLESMPPQCGGARIELAGLSKGMLPGLHAAEGVKWTSEAVTLSGIVREGRLHLAG